jgi:DNA adenine methylase
MVYFNKSKSEIKMQKPFLKWAGNKLKILPFIKSQLGEHTRLVEPFMGSGVFAINTNSRYLGADINNDLISIFHHLQNEPDLFIEYAKRFFGEEYIGGENYNLLRGRFNSLPYSLERAALFLYLNKHGFNGLCRYNQKGEFNVPFNHCKKTPAFPDTELRVAAERCRSSEFKNQPFEKTFLEVGIGDVVYCDPPYLPLVDKKGIVTYTQHAFGLEEHELLVSLARQSQVTVLISNHDSEVTRHLYKDADEIISLDVCRTMGRYNTIANTAKELLVVYNQKYVTNSIIEF